MPTHFTQIVREFGDGTHTFAFPIGALRELEEKRKLSGNRVFRRLAEIDFHVDDLREVIRLGLVHGGGVTPVQAMRLVERYVDNRPLEESVGLALAILGKLLYVDEDTAPQKKSDDATQTSEPTSGSFTATVQ